VFLIIGNIEGSFQGLDLKKRFSVESELMSKIAPHTPSTFMRRSFEIENYYTKEGNVKGIFQWMIEIIRMNIEQVRTICNYDAYIYIFYLRMSAYFFAILTVLNSACLVIYLYVDPEHDRDLSYLQKLTILSMYNSKTKIMCIYVMTIINSIAGYIFLYLFMKIFQKTEFQDYKEDYGDIDVSKTTVMVHNIPHRMPVIEANTLIGQIFKSRFGKDLESVHTVGKYDMRKLDRYYFKRNYMEDKLEFLYNDRKYKTKGYEERVTIYNKD
jgi:hypothetical protein